MKQTIPISSGDQSGGEFILLTGGKTMRSSKSEEFLPSDLSLTVQRKFHGPLVLIFLAYKWKCWPNGEMSVKFILDLGNSNFTK